MMESPTQQFPPPPEMGSTWMHKKGTLYTVLQVTSAPGIGREEEFPVTVTYVGPDGRVWPRTLPRWYASMTPHSASRFKPGSLACRMYLGWLVWCRQRKAGELPTD